ncbi:MAG: hypothetical protein JWR12_3028 [Mucilaginibacter sp.]|nr:hypothetical protein [Mucilaginibacter sp.]
MKNNKLALKMDLKKNTIIKLAGKPTWQFLNTEANTGDTSTTTSLITVTHLR